MKIFNIIIVLLLLVASAFAQRPSEINIAQTDGSVVAMASSTYSSNFSAAQAVNADRTGISWGQPEAKGGGWNSGNSERHGTSTFTIQLGRLYLFSEVVTVGLQSSFGSPVEPDDSMTTVYPNSTFSVAASGDCVNYTTIGSVTGNTKVINHFPVSGLFLGKCVKITFTSSPDGFYRLVEVGVYAKQ